MSCCENVFPGAKFVWLTSAAAERAARMLAEGTAFQRCSVALQKANEFRVGASERLLLVTGNDSLT